MLISELLENHPCKTPGAMFNSKIKGDSVSIKVKLPPQVKIGKMSDEDGEKYDDMMHNAMEKIVAKIVKDTVPNSKEHWNDARKHDINESNDEDIKDVINKNFMITGNLNLNDRIRINNGLVSINGNVRFATALTRMSSDIKLPIKFKSINGDFDISNCGLQTLEGCPTFVYGEFKCRNNRLTSLVGGPEEVHGTYMCFRNPLTSLDGLPKIIEGDIGIPWTPNLPLLKILFVKELKSIIITDHNVVVKNPSDRDHQIIIENILIKYLGQGRKGALACAAELTKAGFKGNAKL